MPGLLLATCDRDAIILARETSRKRDQQMLELIRTNNIVVLSRVESLLEERGITFHVFDTHMSILEGSIGAIPRRLMVIKEDIAAARRILSDAGFGAELSLD